LGGTLDQYDRVIDKMGFQKGGSGGPSGRGAQLPDGG
jgi:hypothetical protein